MGDFDFFREAAFGAGDRGADGAVIAINIIDGNSLARGEVDDNREFNHGSSITG